ncbi:hypothetical protein ACO0QE_000806 [Hanseniaspora vineae]
MSTKKSTAASLLLRQYRELTDPKKAIPSFHIELADDSNIFLWDIGVMVLNEDSIYHGGYFKAQMKFPEDYPFSPPQFRFTPAIYHPNVYRDGRLCISILHQSGNSTSDEPDNETWSPVQTVESVLISIVSLLEDPNINSPANVDAAVEFRKNLDQYKSRVKLEVERSKQDIPAGFVMPTSSLHAYTSAANLHSNTNNSGKNTTTNDSSTSVSSTSTKMNDIRGDNLRSGGNNSSGHLAMGLGNNTNIAANDDDRDNNNTTHDSNLGASASASASASNISGITNESNNNSADNFWYDSDLDDEDDVEMVFYESTDDEGDEIDAADAEVATGKAKN